MPQAMTYTSLLSDVQNYLQRQDALVIAQIPRFIMLAQQRIPREMKLLGFREEVTGIFDGTAQTTGIMQKPSDWRKTIAFFVGTGSTNNVHTPVFERPYEYLRTTYPDPTVTGIPRFYADADFDHWLIVPTPSSAFPFKIPYYQLPAMLDNTVQTNWLTDNAPDVLLYACLLEAIPFLKTDERIPVWQGLYANAKAALQAQDLEGRYDTQAVIGEPHPPSAAAR